MIEINFKVTHNGLPKDSAHFMKNGKRYLISDFSDEIGVTEFIIYEHPDNSLGKEVFRRKLNKSFNQNDLIKTIEEFLQQ